MIRTAHTLPVRSQCCLHFLSLVIGPKLCRCVSRFLKIPTENVSISRRFKSDSQNHVITFFLLFF
uniref:Uncharacterized protein n=1 Tax=Anguilla anguilla TaxID=7936 RepID=A0A0E9WFM4_ANGAN